MRADHDAVTLADRLRSGPLRRAELEQLAHDLLGMLASLHGEGTLHRDLNPDSIRLDSDGRLHSSKIGAQRIGGSAAAAPGQTAHRAYVAPEVLAGGASDVAADLFACGALLADAAGPDAPAPVLVLIGMLTASEPDLRPASAAEALALLGPTPAPSPAPSLAPSPTPSPARLSAPPAPRGPVAGYRQTFEKPSTPAPAPPPPAPPAPAPYNVPTEVIPFPPLTSHAAVVDSPSPATAPLAPVVYAPPPVVTYPRRRLGRAALATLGAILALVVVTGGAVALRGGDTPGREIPPPAAAPLDQQLDDLDGVVDSLGR